MSRRNTVSNLCAADPHPAPPPFRGREKTDPSVDFIPLTGQLSTLLFDYPSIVARTHQLG